MPEVTREQVRAVLAQVRDRNLDRDLITAEAVKEIDLVDGTVSLRLEIGYPADGYRNELIENVSTAIRRIPGVTHASINLDRKSTRLNSSHSRASRMPSSA